MITDSMDAIFRALDHPDRRKILDLLKAHPGSAVNDVCAHFETSRIALWGELDRATI